ncbi:MAG: hypothetical protein PHX54_10810, partial [Lentimicrobiaceae bacterium]|nr:hypothetical protein [Lentimicrobiaceae bacterium]
MALLTWYFRAENMSRIIFINHNWDHVPEPFVGLAYKNYLLKVLIENNHKEISINNFNVATHIIAHWDNYLQQEGDYIPEPERFRSELIKKRDRAFAPLIILRVSSIEGQEEQSQREDKEWKWPETKNTMAYILNAKNQKALQDENVLAAFYSMTHDEARSVFEGKVQNIPVKLRQLFQRVNSPNILSALSILCQGYLVAHANPVGQPEEISDKEFNDVQLALDQMKWPDFCYKSKDKDSLLGVLNNRVADRKEYQIKLRNQCCQPGYWSAIKNILQERSDIDVAIESLRRSEWESLPEKADWIPVKMLLETILEISTARIDPGVVA